MEYRIVSASAIEVDGVVYGKIGMDYSYSFTKATFYNPDSGKSIRVTVSDADDPRRDDWTLYRMATNGEFLKLWEVANGIIREGDTVEVFKGRKVPVGTVARVRKIYPYNDRYGRWCCDYAYLDNGMKTNIANCRLIEKA